jgi:uncharacterized protein (TIRG00374 family)
MKYGFKRWIFILLICYLSWFFLDQRLTASALKAIPLLVYLQTILLLLISFSLRFLRWNILAFTLGYRVSNLHNFFIYCSGFAFTATPGKAGELIRSIFLKDVGVTYVDSLALFIFDRYCDLVSLSCIALIFMLNQNFINVDWFSILISLLVAPYIILNTSFIVNRLPFLWAPWKKMERLKYLESLLLSLTKLFSAREFIFGVILGVIAWSLVGLVFYLILGALGVNLDYISVLGSTSVSLVAGALSFIPGGVGVTEYIQSSILIALGGSEGLVLNATFIGRMLTLCFAILFGSFCLLLVLKYRSGSESNVALVLKTTQKQQAEQSLDAE